MIVIDASVVVDAALGNMPLVALIYEAELHAPATIDAEVLHALRRAYVRDGIQAKDADLAVEFVARLSITRHWIKPLVPRMWALRHNITAYDAGYVALAESLGYPLLTRDRRLAHSAGHTARIEYID